jgi:hypothetical protein
MKNPYLGIYPTAGFYCSTVANEQMWEMWECENAGMCGLFQLHYLNILCELLCSGRKIFLAQRKRGFITILFVVLKKLSHSYRSHWQTGSPFSIFVFRFSFFRTLPIAARNLIFYPKAGIMTKKEKKDKSLIKPDPETKNTTDPQDHMEGPISSLVQDVKENVEDNDAEDKKEADKKKEKKT